MSATAQEAFVLAENAARSARDAHDKADTAISGLRELHGDLGGFASELAGNRGAIQQLSTKTSALELKIVALDRLIRESLQKLGAGLVQAKEAAMKSSHDLDEFKETSEVTELRKEHAQVKARFESMRARDKKIRDHGASIIVGVLVVVVSAWALVKCGLHT